VERDESLSLAYLVLLERLGPVERLRRAALRRRRPRRLCAQPDTRGERVGRLLAGLIAKRFEPLASGRVTGLWLTRADGTHYSPIGLGFSADGERVSAIYAIRNPDKLRASRRSARAAT
jgi:hypothetical protein